MADTQPLLLILPERSDWAEANALPADSDNLFQRIIRNPHIESAKPRERECTEMLCAVLLNTRELRLHLLRWLADLAGHSIPDLGNLDFAIDTEQPIGSKRDDLRIEGLRSKDEEQERVFLWTIEVKVGADFHDSSPLDLPESEDDELLDEELHEEDAKEDEELVSQLINYDDWLVPQPAQHRAGFVLAIQNKTAKLPANLVCDWKCFTWSDLGLQVKAALDEKNIPADESLLARHMLGFIREHLWSATEMAKEELTFDDIALVRAFHLIGSDCDNKINRLVALLEDVLKQSGVGVGEINHQKKLFSDNDWSLVHRRLFNSQYPELFMGILDGDISLTLETPPKNPNKVGILKAIESFLSKLQQRNRDWSTYTVEQEPYWDLRLKVPLTMLLNVPDQDAAFKEFFVKALDDFKSVGAAEAIKKALKHQ